MAKVILNNISGSFHCDACGCNEPAGLTPDQLTEAHIGRPCPQCGASMLTAEDYAEAKKAAHWISLANKWLGPLFGKEESQWDADDREEITINPRKSGWTIKTGGEL